MASLTRSLAWLAPLIALIGFLSYFLFFNRFPALRDFPWVNLPLVLLGAILSIWALAKGGAGISRGKRVVLVLSALFSNAVAALLVLYVFVLSYQVPAESETTMALGAAPDFTLNNGNGEAVSLSDFRGQRVILSFYRGFW